MSAYPTLILTLRFATSLPDLRLKPIESPSTTSGLSLLPQIRSHLPTTCSTLRITLISGGRVVPLSEPLTTALRLPSAKALGKTKALDGDDPVAAEGSDEAVRWIIHAAFSTPDTALSVEELEQELDSGNTLNASLQASTETHTNEQGALSTALPDPTSSPLQGFDRLSSAGIPTSEITSLRTQFRSLLAVASAPGAPPLTPIEYLILEERWLDDAALPSGVNGGADTLASLATHVDGTGTASAAPDHVDDVLWGNILGFFWPLGGLLWLSRQEGVMSDRKRLSVMVGVMVNVAFCILRAGLIGGAG